MKIKVLLGCLGAVTLLILVSFTNVIGVQPTNAKSANDSPLFAYRTTKAIEKTSDAFQYNYIGKGKVFHIPISTLANKEKLILKIIGNILAMDDSAFNTLLAYCSNRLTRDPTMSKSNIANIVLGLQNLRKNPEHILDQIINKSSGASKKYDIRSQQYTMFGDWIPGCLLAAIFYMIFIFPILVLLVFFSAWQDCFQSIGTNCDDCPCYRVQINRYLYDLDVNS